MDYYLYASSLLASKVQSILELLNDGLSFEEIIRDYYLDLQIDDIGACLQYAIALVSK
ncbi:DUF433 domain-containing protein [Nostoc sp. CHAB 5784]|uniref:DUF433 domain-containing protein n=1 Tax=Nostoc mirabile TaxID=2907820 RepID=UPI001E374BC7|nr:DUF433 domain-containing protein [Nostoc mirabile]MCC5665676.1 DUF433 domain-containing protein [Nostoc mirabile CHAB5784]